jgi:hypothetical protein
MDNDVTGHQGGMLVLVVIAGENFDSGHTELFNFPDNDH